MHRLSLAILLATAALLAGCDMLGIETPEKVAAARDADGRAIGGACRHAGRAIEDCYAMNKKADKAAVFAGWRDMNDYMRENKIDPVTPQLTNPVVTAKAGDGGDTPAEADTDKKPTRAKPADKAKTGKPSES